jgi:hypothetical protein
MKTWHFWQILLLFCILLGGIKATQAQSSALGVGLQWGKSIANHPRYPALRPSVAALELQYQLNTATSFWQQYYPKTRLSILFNYQQTGNAAVLGHAWAVAPMLSFELRSKNSFSLNAQVAWGLAYVSKRFDSFDNPSNIVIGSYLNAFASARLQAGYQIGAWQPRLSLLVSHYSNGNYNSPNLGINLASVELGLNYHWQKEIGYEGVAKEIKQPQFSPFIQIGLGATSRISRGPIFPVYVISTGLHWQYHPRAFAGAALEYSINTAVYAFRQHNSLGAFRRAEFDRYCFWLNHEFLFGRVGFQTLGGIYLNKHIEQRSIFATELGLNFYLKNPYFYHRHQTWIGVHVRAYMGLAEFVMLQVGYKW